MYNITTALERIASARREDPLAPVTVIVPSHAAALQLRRRLAELTAFAAVRFETLPRLAELAAAGHLAGEGRLPLARPIGDYLTGRVALESRRPFERVSDLPGYARALRQAFRRLRRGGIRRSSDVVWASGEFAEVLRLYDRFRESTAQFYDEEDLLDAAASVVRDGRAGIMEDLGSVFVLPPGAQSAGAAALLSALEVRTRSFAAVEDEAGEPVVRMILAPDPASEVREVVREVISALERGLGVQEVAVFHGADSAYPKLLREACESARLPAVLMPGVRLAESGTGRAVLALLNLPAEGFSRTRTMDFFALAPLRDWIPVGSERVRAAPAVWDRISRAAGVTRGLGRWMGGLAAYGRDLEVQLAEDPRVLESEALTRLRTFELDRAGELRDLIGTLAARLAPLELDKPAAEFIAEFSGIVDEYISRDAEGYEDVLREIAQLGTVDAVGGSFNLGSFHEALRANLEAGILKEARLKMGQGVLVADYRMAAGLRFRHVVLCGAYEGALPAGPGAEPILDDRTWTRLKDDHPFIEDSSLRMERSREAAARAVRSAGGGSVTWSCPLYEPGATRDYYPSPLMVAAASSVDAAAATATKLRRLGAREWLRRAPSPLGTMLHGPATDAAEVSLRGVVTLRRSGQPIGDSHALWRPVQMLRARRSGVFTEWDGNLGAMEPVDRPTMRQTVSPTSLEHYAACGFRYFCRSVLGINVVEQPEEREMMDAAARGGLVHDVLERFFRRMITVGRPKTGERWTAEDRRLLLAMLNEALSEAKKRGQSGREVYAGHESRMLRADLLRFLDEDDEFRQQTGAAPVELEAAIPERAVAGVTLRGRVDRVDRTPDGEHAWVIDYKTGSKWGYDRLGKGDPLAGGTKLQLPVYLAAAGAAKEARALYWFITHRGGFEQVEFNATPENMALFESTVHAIVEGVSGGVFPAVSGEEDDFRGGWSNCRYCDFDRICSRRRDYEYTIKAADAAMAPWQLVSEAARPPETVT